MEHEQLIVGFHAVDSWLRTGQAQPGDCLLVDERRRDQRLQGLLRQAKKRGVEICKRSRRELDRCAAGVAHQGVVVEVVTQQPQRHYDEDWLLDLVEQADHPLLLLILDGITDPHNLGACLRSAEAAGVDAVVVPRDRSAGMGPVVRKVASGAAERVPFVTVVNLARLLKKLADLGIWVVGTAGEATDLLYQADLTPSLALVMGAEGEGMRRLTKAQCNQLVKIPMAGSVSSLNVSVATGIVLFEGVRQRHLALSRTSS
ncbi:MAG: 23S rRNA (guanosine(2251)-2'-O)-methyltransferase RlmB [Gammaproteobacteria bacterium]|jgi:23S rRNA (guanosine2251-2'-O)-methyltransferase|nr:23S rRNA (guanosine(2251)-2'-O)-methyltransferase RlmB [Gammaproteobacteria bacterium]MBT7308185.1 23S rRNA (guanosine(2251)-2'-O)-methyltransferase RlmB [Gammaproteobacteria bacterium]